MEEQIKSIMENLGVSREEALEVLEFDDAIDHGDKNLGRLSPEQEKAVKKMKNTGRGPKVYEFKQKRKKKEDADKRYLIDAIVSCLIGNVKDLQITIEEREMVFNYNGRKFKIVLSAPRT